jgi:ATP-binding cassette subfamily C protein
LTGHVLPVASSAQARRWLLTALRPERKTLLAAAVLLVLGTSAELATTRVMGAVIDAVTNGSARGRIDSLAVLIAGLVATAITLTFVGRKVLAAVVERSLTRLRNDAFAGSLRMHLADVEQAGVSDPLMRMTSDIATVSTAMHATFPTLVTGSLTLLLSMVALIVTSPLLALAATAGFPVVFVVARRYFRMSSSVYAAEREATASMVREMHEITDGSRTIRAYRRQARWLERLDATVVDEWESSLGPMRVRCMLYAGGNVARVISLASVLLVGMIAYQQSWASLGLVSAATLLVVQFYTPLGDFFEALDSLQTATTAGTRIVGLTLLEPDVPSSTSAPAPKPVDGRVELRDVWFGYDSNRAVLRGVSLDIPSGSRVAVVGTSGAGKSTIAKLVAGIHTATSGLVLVGGVPVQERISGGSEHTAVALVTQEAHVFMGSIADNLRLAAPQAEDEQLLQALHTVQADAWVAQLPQGMHTRTGRNGHQLTLLQAQQVALARVLLSDPLVVILDEATASFDGDSARGVEGAFAALFEGRTVITIAHRLDVAAGADQIVVVDNGGIICAAHDELLDIHPAYATMWKRWAQR